jgi:hypothetical protein
MTGNRWTDQEMYQGCRYNMQVGYALDYSDFRWGKIELRALDNFRECLNRYLHKAGINILNLALQQMIGIQIGACEIKPGKQQADSTQKASNIWGMGCLHLHRWKSFKWLFGMMAEKDREGYEELFRPLIQVIPPSAGLGDWRTFPNG